MAEKIQPKVPSPLEEHARHFLEHLEIEMNRSLRTIESYHRVLHAFFVWGNLRTPADMTAQRVREYRLYLNRKPNGRGDTLKKNTQAYQAIVLRTFLKYLAKQDVKTLAAEKVEVGKVPDRQVDFLEFEEVERLIAAATGTEVKQLRDRAILELLFSSGFPRRKRHEAPGGNSRWFGVSGSFRSQGVRGSLWHILQGSSAILTFLFHSY